MSTKHKQQDAPTIAPKFDVQAYARETERRIAAASGVTIARVHTRSMTPVELRASMAVPRAARLPSGVDFAERAPVVVAESVPVLVAREHVTELLTFPTESFLLSYIDGARDIDAIARESGLPRDLVVVTVSDLVRSGVVVLNERPR